MHNIDRNYAALRFIDLFVHSGIEYSTIGGNDKAALHERKRWSQSDLRIRDGWISNHKLLAQIFLELAFGPVTLSPAQLPELEQFSWDSAAD